MPPPSSFIPSAILATETEDDYDVQALTTDHKPDVEQEKKRILEAGMSLSPLRTL